MTRESELEQRAANGDKDSQIALARRLENEGRNELAREWYARAAERGDLSALVSLAKNLLARKPVRAQIGVNMVRTAAERGDSEALHICAVIASQDMNLHARWRVALDFLVGAAEKGSVLARRELQLLSGSEDAAPARSFQDDARRVNIERWLKPAPPQTCFEAPRIVTCTGFATAAECDWLIQRAGPRLKPAEVYDPQAQGGLRADEIRNNSDTSFDIVESDLVLMALRERIARLAQLQTDEFEPTMVLHFENGQRVATFLLYLNDDFEGGETDFPALGWRYKGRKGDALLFWNVDATGLPDPATLHAGLKPVRGEKWVLSQWMRRKSQPMPA